MRKDLMLFFVILSSIGLVSAQGTLSDLLNQIDQQTLILFGIFLVAFALMFFALSRFFKGNAAIAGIISAVISFLIVYAVNKSGLDFSSFLYSWGISSDVLLTLIPLIILGTTVILIIKFKKESLLILGGEFILLTIILRVLGQPLYAETLVIVIGVVLIIVRFLIPKGRWEMPQKRKSHGYYLEDIRGRLGLD